MTIPKLLFASQDGMRATPAVLTKDYNVGDESITCTDLSGWPEYASFILYEVNANGELVADSTHLDLVGKVAGNTITELEITAGSDRPFSKNLARVVVDETSYVRNELIKALKRLLTDKGFPATEIKVEDGKLKYKVDDVWKELTDKISGKELSTNDFTNDLKSKLDGIEVGSQVNKLEKISIADGSNLPITEKGITLPDYALKTDIASVYRVKGSLANLDAIKAVSSKRKGDVYNAEDTGMNYVWTGNEWDAIGSTIDLTDYVTNAKLQEALAGLGSNGSSEELSNAVSDLQNELSAVANKLNEIIGEI